MQNIALRTRLKSDKVDAYIEAHDNIWPEVVENLKRVGVTQYLIFRDGLDLFHAVTCENYDAALEALRDDPVDQRWQAAMAEFTDVPVDMSGAGGRLELIFRLDA